MSSTSNAQDLLVNVFRPTYRWDAGTGFTPSLVVSNVTELIAGSVKTAKLAVSDSNANTYIGSNAGPLSNVTTTFANTAIGYSAMASASNSSNNVSIGTSNFALLANANSNVGLGANTRMTGAGQKNILIGANLTLGTGSGNIVIGNDLSLGTISNTFRLGSLLYGDLSQGYIGINTPTPQAPLDISGIVVFRNKVGFQNPNPVYSLDVAGSVYATDRYIAGRGTSAAPVFDFLDTGGNLVRTGLYQPTDASYGTGALGLVVGQSTRGVIMSNKTILYGGLDVCGTVTSSGGSASFLAGPGSVSEPAYSFSGSSDLGMYRTTDASGTAVSIAIGGTSRLVVGSNKVTILGNFDVCGTLSAAAGGGGGGGSGTIAANGTASAPSFTFGNDLSTGLHLVKTSTLAFDTSGVQRMCISGGFVGIATPTPLFPLDVSGVVRASGPNGYVSFSNGRIDVSGLASVASNGAISNAAITSNTIGGITLSNSTVVTGDGSAAAPALTVGDVSSGFYRPFANSLYASVAGVKLAGMTSNLVEFSNRGSMVLWLTDNQLQASQNLVGTPAYAYAGDASTGFYRIGAGQVGFATAGINRTTFDSNGVTTSNLVASGYLRNALVPTQFDISGGNISNSGTHTSTTFFGNSTTSNQIGGVTLSNTNISNSGFTTSDRFTTGTVIFSNQIGGVTLSNYDLCMSTTGRILGMAGTSNSIGGVTLSNSNVSYAGTITGTTSSASNQIGGVTLSNTNISYAGAISNTTASSSNSIGGVTLSNSNVVTWSGVRGSPALSVGDVSSGFFRETANSVTVSIAGIKTANFSNNLIEFSNSGVQALWLYNNQLQSAVGSVSAPAYSYAVDASLGFYRVGAGQVAFTSAGSNRLLFSNANLGIGTMTPGFNLDVSGNANIQAGNGTGALYVGGSSTGVVVQRDAGGNGYLRALGTGINLYLGTSNSNTMTLLSTGYVGVGTVTPSYTLDICAAAGAPSLNMTSWPRIPLSNCLMVKGIPSAAQVGNTLNFNTVVRTINSTLGTFVASNATSGGSFLINKAGIWSITLTGSTGTGTNLWLDVSTGNHSNITVYTNGNPVLAAANSPGSGTSNVATCAFTGFLPSNIYVKARINGTLGGDGDVVWRLNAIFQAETDAVTTWPF